MPISGNIRDFMRDGWIVMRGRREVSDLKEMLEVLPGEVDISTSTQPYHSCEI